MATEETKIPKIKICGITRVEEALYLKEAQVEYAGFVFWEGSRRNVSFAQAKEIGERLDSSIKRVAVVVSPDVKLLRQVEQAGFDILQVHGSLKNDILAHSRIPIWQACNLGNPREVEKLVQHENISGYVIDAAVAGSGRTFDWDSGEAVVEQAKRHMLLGKTFVLAGGLKPGNAAEAVGRFRPDVVDVSSGVEGPQGKELGLILEFAAAINKADA